MDIFDKNDIHDLTDREYNKMDFFEEVADLAFKNDFVEDSRLCLSGLIDRENEGTTGFQDGIAIPHCKNQTVLKPKMLIFKTNPIKWESLDGKPTTFFFVLLIPEKSADIHLRLLAKIARSLIDDDFRNVIQSADTDDLYSIITKKIEV